MAETFDVETGWVNVWHPAKNKADVIIPITVTRERSVKLIKQAEKNNKIIGVVAQKDSKIELPKLKAVS